MDKEARRELRMRRTLFQRTGHLFHQTRFVIKPVGIGTRCETLLPCCWGFFVIQKLNGGSFRFANQSQRISPQSLSPASFQPLSFFTKVGKTVKLERSETSLVILEQYYLQQLYTN